MKLCEKYEVDMLKIIIIIIIIRYTFGIISLLSYHNITIVDDWKKKLKTKKLKN